MREDPDPSDPRRGDPTLDPTLDPAAGAPVGAGGATLPAFTWPPSATNHPDPLNVRIGRYEIRREIAAGGMGSVYEAVQDQPRRSVALKLLRGGFDSPSSLKRFEDEAQHLARLHHPGIAQVYDAGSCEIGGRSIPYIAMELIPGARWITEFASLKRLSRRQRLELFAQACDAVHHGHQKGIIHRDLKPGNILVDSAGRVKVIDFGVSSTLEGGSSAAEDAHEPQRLIGTLQYMSPEQCDPEAGELSVRSDVYALGIVLYELLCGRLPYDVDPTNLNRAEQIIREQPPTRPALLDRSLRGDLETILLKAMHKSPGQRYASAAELGEDVRRVLRGEPILARADSAIYLLSTRLKTLIARHQVSAGLLACVLGVLFAQSLGVLAVSYTPAEDVFVRFTSSLFPPRAEDLMSRVRIITVRDGTDVVALAQSAGVEGVSAHERPSRRRLHGKLAEVLAESGARVVVFDMDFPIGTGHDQHFVKGVQALRKANIPTVVGVKGWQLDADGLPRLSRIIAPHVRWGGLTFDDRGPWALLLYAVQDDSPEPLPSLALSALAAYWHRDAELFLKSDLTAHAIELRFWKRNPAAPSARQAVAPPRTIRTTGMTQWGEHGMRQGLSPGAWAGMYQLQMPGEEVFRTGQIDLDYAEVLQAPVEKLRRWFAGRVVVIGYADTASNDLHEYMDGRVLPGCYAHAVGIDALIRGQGVLHPWSTDQPLIRSQLTGINLSAAGLGVIAVVLAGARRRRRFVYLAGVAVGIVILSLLAYWLARYLFNPLLPIIAMVVAGLVMSYAVALRHRVFG